MGMFSWETCDTNRSISNKYSDRGTFLVKMILPDNTVVEELKYNGYGVFGNLDFYEEVARFSLPKEFIEGDSDHNRGIGIGLFFDNDEDVKVLMPKFVEGNIVKWEDLPDPENCQYQG